MPLERQAGPPLFEELLSGAGVIKSADLKRCVELAFDRGMLISDVLVNEGLLTTRVLIETLRLQRLIRHAGFSTNEAINALAEVVDRERELIAVLLESGWDAYKLAYVSEVGRLLLDAEVLEPSQMAVAVSQAFRQSVLLGSYLLKEDIITQTTLWSALQAVAIAESGKMSRAEVIDYFKTAVKRQFRLELVLPDTPEDSRRPGEWIRLGELLATGGIISEAEVLGALEGAMDLGVPLGKFLVVKLMLNADQVRQALDIQTLVSTGQITPLQAAGVAKQVLGRDLPISEAVRRVRNTAEVVKKATQANKIIALDENG
jgi:hypothetical protein